MPDNVASSERTLAVSEWVEFNAPPAQYRSFRRRSFSKLKLIKTRPLRFSMTDKRLCGYQWLPLSVTLHANLILLQSLVSLHAESWTQKSSVGINRGRLILYYSYFLTGLYCCRVSQKTPFTVDYFTMCTSFLFNFNHFKLCLFSPFLFRNRSLKKTLYIGSWWEYRCGLQRDASSAVPIIYLLKHRSWSASVVTRNRFSVACQQISRNYKPHFCDVARFLRHTRITAGMKVVNCYLYSCICYGYLKQPSKPNNDYNTVPHPKL